MMETYFKQFVRYNYFFGLALMIVSLPFSKFMLSVGQWWITGAWIFERLDLQKIQNFYHNKARLPFYLLIFPYILCLMAEGIGKGFKEFFKNKPAMIIASLFMLHVAGLIFTTDFQYAFKDLRTKIPLFILPLFLSTSETLSKKVFYRYLLLFILALTVGTIINTWKVINHDYLDIRDVAHHVGHIIFGLLICFSLFTLGYFIVKKNHFSFGLKIVFAFVFIWLTTYLFITKSITGFAVFLLTLMILLPVLIFRRKNRWLQTGLILLIVAVTAGVFLYLQRAIHDFYHIDPVDYSRLEKYTTRGNPYEHNPFNQQTENGKYLWLYVQWDELRDSWNKRSQIRFDNLDLKGNPVKFTIIRFLTSKGERKDADAVDKLSDDEIKAIEKGIANTLFLEKFSIRGRIYEFLMGYENYRQSENPTGSTIMQRLEFWKASLGLISDNWLYGVGTGDMNTAFHQQYEKMQTKLAPDQRWRSHNQFLSIFIGFGIFGLLWFLFAIGYPPLKLRWYDDFFFLIFLVIALLSMLTEDTIESQTGVTFFAFFYSFLLFLRKEKDPV